MNVGMVDPQMTDALDLLDRQHVFTQRALLSPKQFADASRERGHWLTESHLEALHRARLLVPLFRVRRPAWDIAARREAASQGRYEGPDRQWSVPKSADELREDASSSLLRPSRATRFRPWADDEVPLATGRIRRVEYLYSPWQLLELRRLDEDLPLLQSPRSKWNRARLAALRQRASRADLRVLLLSAIEPRYYPGLVDSVKFAGPEEQFDRWLEYRDGFDAVEMLRWMAWNVETLYEAAQDALWNAHIIDPLANWTSLVDQVAPRLWERLKGDALLAIEGRIAGEMLLRLYEDLVTAGAAQALPTPPVHAQHELHWRIPGERSQLDSTLSDFGLSPHPSVVLSLEGETEMELVPLVMEELGLLSRESFITVVRMGGETRPGDHRVLAEYVALPRLGPVQGDFAPFLPPPTTYFIAVDGDRTFATQAARDAERTKWASLLVDALDPTLRDVQVVKDQMADLVRVEAWGDGVDFERAHFTDEEIATTLFAQGWVPAGVSRVDVETELARVRSQNENISRVWRAWPWKPPKPQLALALWPVLRTKIRRKRSRAGLDTIPVARVVFTAADLARNRPRRHVVLRVR